MGQPLYCSAVDAGIWGDRGCGDGSTPYVWLSSIALLPWLPAFPPLAFPTTISSLTSPNPSLHSQQQPLPWNCSTIPKLQLPAAAPSSEPSFLSRICMAPAKTVWFPFYLGYHRSAVSLSALNVSPLTQLPWCGVQTPASVSLPTEGRSRPTNTSVFPLSSFILPSFAWFYIFFSKVLLYTLSWCSACTSVSECVFLMNPWKEMYSTSTYSSTILFSPPLTVLTERTLAHVSVS